MLSPDTSSTFADNLLAHTNLADPYWQPFNLTHFSKILWIFFLGPYEMTAQSPLDSYKLSKLPAPQVGSSPLRTQTKIHRWSTLHPDFYKTHILSLAFLFPAFPLYSPSPKSFQWITSRFA